MALNVGKGTNFSAWGSLSGSAASPSAHTYSEFQQGHKEPGTTHDRSNTEVMAKPAETLFLAQKIWFISTIQLLWTRQCLLPSTQQGRGRNWTVPQEKLEQQQAGGMSSTWCQPTMKACEIHCTFIGTVKLGLITFNIAKNITICNFHAIGKPTSVALL